MKPAPIETAYPLSPIQLKMLCHNLSDPHAGADIDQLVISLHETLDVALFRQAWQHLLDRHPVLRTDFCWQGLEIPEQRVHQHITVPLQSHNLRDQPATRQQHHIKQHLQQCRRHGFDLTQTPLMRIDLFQLARTEFLCVWTVHHILIDGRSLPILLEELFVIYQALCTGQPVLLPEPVPFQRYIDWLTQQNRHSTQSFWRQTLAGLPSQSPAGVQKEPLEFHTREKQFSEAVTEELRAFSGKQQLSLYTLVLGAWALLLHRYSNELDIVVGATVSCRRKTVPEAEAIVGPLISTIPLRIKVNPWETVASWLLGLQNHLRDLREKSHIYPAAAKIQPWRNSPGRKASLNSVVVFENYVMEQMHGICEAWWERGTVQLLEQTGYPLTLNSCAGPELALKLTYNRSHFDDTTIAQMLDHLETLLTGMPRLLGQCIALFPLPHRTKPAHFNHNETTTRIKI